MKKTPKNFEEALKKLEELTSKMQNSDIPLEEALKYYEEGKELASFCQNKLSEVEQKLAVLDHDNLTGLNLDEC